MTDTALRLAPEHMTSRGVLVPAALRDTVQVRDTYWGYVISRTPENFDIDIMADRALRFLGLIVLACAYAQWLLPDTVFSGNVIVMKLLLSLILGALGACVYAMGCSARAPEVQIDLSRRELRFCTRSSRGAAETLRILPMDAIESVVIRYRQNGTGPAQLFVRVAQSGRLVSVVSGPKSTLKELHPRLVSDLKPPSARIEARLAETPVFTSCRSAA